MVYLRTLLLILICLASGGLSAQNLMSTPISVAPFYFNATPTSYPPMSIPYQLPPYWQQQSFNPWASLVPAFSQFANTFADDLSRPSDDIIYAEDFEPRRSRYSISGDFLYERESRAARRTPNTRASTSPPEPASTSASTSAPTSTPTPVQTAAPVATNDQCDECLSNGNNSTDDVIAPQTRDIAAVISEISNNVLDESLTQYQESDQVQTMVRSIREGSLKRRDRRRQIIGRKTSEESLGRCLMYVKFAMLEAGYFGAYPGGMYASDFSPALESRGFQNLMTHDAYNMTDPEDAPIGSIIVYENTPGSTRPGHIEVKLDNGEYGSDYIDDQARSETSSNRKIIGIYAKLPESES